MIFQTEFSICSFLLIIPRRSVILQIYALRMVMLLCYYVNNPPFNLIFQHLLTPHDPTSTFLILNLSDLGVSIPSDHIVTLKSSIARSILSQCNHPKLLYSYYISRLACIRYFGHYILVIKPTRRVTLTYNVPQRRLFRHWW